MGELMARNLQVNPRYTEPYWPGTSWYKSFDFQIEQETAHIAQIDQRATWFYEAVASRRPACCVRAWGSIAGRGEASERPSLPVQGCLRRLLIRSTE